jgi:serine protease Do
MNVRSSYRRLFLAAGIVLSLLLAACQAAFGTQASDNPSNAANAATAPAAANAATVPAAATTLPASATDAPTAAAAATPASTNGSSGTAAAPAGGGDLRTLIRQVAQQVKPAVVQITNEQVQLDQSNQPFTVPAGVGSGVIYDNQGHILTNNHVIEGAQNLSVALPDGAIYPGKLIGADPKTDLAVVQISGSNLPVAQLGDSTQLQVGDWVVAIGNALALQGGPTVSVGVVGALGRTVQEPGSDQNSQGPYLFDVIQTDAPINPGNSGGPLVNLDGQVIGINTLVAGQAEPGVQAQGIGFSIAIGTAKPIADELVATGHVIHPFVGISYVPLNQAIAQQLGITAKTGVVVAEVVSGSPAAAAGLQPRDTITALDGTALATESTFAQLLNKRKVGDVVTLTVLRGKQTLQLKVTLADQPAQ